MRTINVNVTTADGVLLGSTTFQVPDETRRLEIVDAEPYEGPYQPLAELDISKQKQKQTGRPHRGR